MLGVLRYLFYASAIVGLGAALVGFLDGYGEPSIPLIAAGLTLALLSAFFGAICGFAEDIREMVLMIANRQDRLGDVGDENS